MNKREKEKAVLEKFIDEFDNRINILTDIEAKEIFPKYNCDNPDFIVQNNADYIGIDLFHLASSKNTNSLMSQEEKKYRIQNLFHLEKIRENLGTKLLYENEDLGKVAVERINHKILYKIKNYVTDKIWLLGYANQKFNFRLLEDRIEDNTVNLLLNYIRKNILYEVRVKRIFLFQCWANNRIFSVL